MRKSLLLFFVLVSIIQVQGQQKSMFSIGAGALMYTVNEEERYTYHLTGFPSIFIEKACYLNMKDRFRLGVKPGLNYSRFKEYYESSSSALGGWSTIDLKHSSFVAYSKLTLNFRTRQTADAEIYLGVLGGIHILTKSKGRKEGYIRIDPPYHWDDKIDSNGKDFFHPAYYGFLIGTMPSADETSRIRPAFELSYLPSYAKAYSDKGGMVQFTVLLHFKQAIKENQ